MNVNRRGRRVDSSPKEIRTGHVTRIGKGNFGTVYLFRDYNDFEPKALKVFNKKKDFEKELKYLTLFKGIQGIPKIYNTGELESGDKFILMNYIRGSNLLDLTKDVDRFSTRDIKIIIFNLLNILSEIHELECCHRDIKLENVMLNHKGDVYLIDWNLAGDYSLKKKLNKACGSLHYASPEIFSRQSYDGAKTDIWSLGVLSYCLLTGYFPYYPTNPFNADVFTFDDEELNDFMKHMLEYSPDKRWTANQLLEHPWLYTISSQIK